MNLKEEIKNYAYSIGADLVGFGNIERCKHAPLKMSPQGVFPGAKSLVVMGIHHPDACIEKGGEEHPQKIGPYSVQYLMNSRLDELSYRMATFLEEKGAGAIPICSSNIWRYNKYKDLDAVFAPDISHIYMPVVAGLADMGYSGLALTREYGARNRFITVITDVEIEPDPLIPPGTLCDRCMLCRKHCPSGALSKEIDGEKVLKIENYEYKFANKNLWRCAWGEHFDLDLDLDIPEKVTEEIIIEKVKKHGIRSGEMGQCLKFCVPKKIRTFDKEYSKSPVRKYCVTWDESIESRAVTDKMISDCYAKGIEHVAVESKETLAAKGIDIDKAYQGAKTAITLISTWPDDKDNKRKKYTDAAFLQATGYHLNSASYDLTRKIEEIGFRALMNIGFSSSHPDELENPTVNMQIAKALLGSGKFNWFANTVYTTKQFPERSLNLKTSETRVPSKFRKSATLSSELKKFAFSIGADMTGIASSRRVSDIAGQLKKHFEDETIFTAVDKSHRFKLWEPEITETHKHVFTPEDYMTKAKSVIVIGLRFHKEVINWAIRSPSESVGPYAFQTYVTRWHCGVIAARVADWLKSSGYKAVITPDLMGIGSAIASPRGFIEDLYCNRFSAVAAGLGTLTEAGRVLTEDFETRQRFIAIVTDAELAEDPLITQAPELCGPCDKRCKKACPTKAITDKEISFACDGVNFKFSHIDANRCDWSKRYALAGEGGFKYLGSAVNEIPQGDVTKENLANALAKHDPIKKYRPVACEPCALNCPYSREQN